MVRGLPSSPIQACLMIGLLLPVVIFNFIQNEQVDFNKWKDEDDSGDELNDNSYESMMKQLGAGGAPDFSNFNMDDKEDSDEDSEQLPDLE
ncbi:hypothetical protein RND71_043978 [Anisodus tanguticus]|uniref:Uncharacterized protein n=1 Tax=Anisodus tanguticus TaxID=243964 RepID=A0AAE1QNX7_9SOLA|nr:hypothetical protein RND71_043978 [Anisodus tanguticus]